MPTSRYPLSYIPNEYFMINSIEFFDHTFDEHFGCDLPMFLPRDAVLSYILKRCTKNNPNFFDDVKFNTNVENVSHDSSNKFTVKFKSLETNLVACATFDYCIWAGGENGLPNMPKAIDTALKSGGFKGKIMHSSQTDANFDKHVRDKNIMIVGDQYSAEDLTLQAIKLGVESVEIVTRRAEGVASYMGWWPEDKVSINKYYIPTGVSSDGRGIICSEVDPGDDSKIVEGSTVTLDDIDTVIYCTGYKENFTMLDDALKPDIWQKIDGAKIQKENNWRMTRNPLTKVFGDVPLGDIYPDSSVSFLPYHKTAIIVTVLPYLKSTSANCFSVCVTEFVSWTAAFKSFHVLHARTHRISSSRLGCWSMAGTCSNNWRPSLTFC